MKKFFYRKSFWTMAGIICASAVLMVACPEKNHNNEVAAVPCAAGQYCPPGGMYPPGAYPPGMNQNGGYAIASGVGQLDYNGSFLALTFSAANGQMPYGGMVGMGGISSYSGPVVAFGEINFVGGPGCPGLMPGRFPIVNTLQPGNYVAGSISNLILQAANGMQVKLPNNFLMTQNGSGPSPIRIMNPVYLSPGMGVECAFVSM